MSGRTPPIGVVQMSTLPVTRPAERDSAIDVINRTTAEFQYVSGQKRDSFGPLLASFDERNAGVSELPHWERDLPYGTHTRETADVLPLAAGALGTVMYFHAGYWQSRDKAQFRFLAPAFNAMGWHAALVNYPLCPEASVARIVESAGRALRQLRTHQFAHGRTGAIVLCGHSAGAHLAIELALQATTAHDQMPCPVAGVVAISGIYDLQPLVTTSLNTRLQLSADTAQACSPLLRARTGTVPALFIVGETETPAFHEQNDAMARQWKEHRNVTLTETVPGADHFSVLDRVTAPGGLLCRSLASWVK